MTEVPCARCGAMVQVQTPSVGNLQCCRACGLWMQSLPEAAADQVTFTVLAGPDKDLSRTLAVGAVLGRGRDADFKVIDSDVSRKHARLLAREGRVFIEDLGSRHGVCLNGQKVTLAALAEGDEIRLGPHTLLRCSLARTVATHVLPRSRPEAAVRPETVLASCGAGETALFREPEAADGSETRLRQLHAKLQMVCSATEALSTELDSDRLVERMLELVFEVTPADRGCVLLGNAVSGGLAARAVRERNGALGQSPSISSSIATRVMNERVALLVADTLLEEGLAPTSSIVSENIRSAICAPMVRGDRLFGVIYLDAVGRTNAFDRDDLTALLALARQTAIGLENAERIAQAEQDAVVRSGLRFHLPGHLVDRVFRKEVELSASGVQREVTVLFADLRGFADVMAAIDPGQVVELLNAFFKEMIEVVFKHEGTIDRIIGDGMVAAWGAAVRCEDAAIRATRCAVEMQSRLQLFNQLHWNDGWPILTMGIGVNTGAALVGSLGDSRRADFMILGDTVKLAGRMEALNKELQASILIGEETWNRTRDQVIGKVRIANVRGLEHPLTMFAVEGIRAESIGAGGDRRGAPRLQLVLDSRVVLHAGGERIEAVLTSVSKTGAGLDLSATSAASLKHGQIVDLTITPPGAGPITRAVGTVARIMRMTRAGEPYAQIGIHFGDEAAGESGGSQEGSPLE